MGFFCYIQKRNQLLFHLLVFLMMLYHIQHYLVFTLAQCSKSCKNCRIFFSAYIRTVECFCCLLIQFKAFPCLTREMSETLRGRCDLHKMNFWTLLEKCFGGKKIHVVNFSKRFLQTVFYESKRTCSIVIINFKNSFFGTKTNKSYTDNTLIRQGIRFVLILFHFLVFLSQTSLRFERKLMSARSK